VTFFIPASVPTLVKAFVEAVEKVPKQIPGRDAEESDLIECATINDLMLKRGAEIPENIVLTRQKDFSYRLVRHIEFPSPFCKKSLDMYIPVIYNHLSWEMVSAVLRAFSGTEVIVIKTSSNTMFRTGSVSRYSSTSRFLFSATRGTQLLKSDGQDLA